MISACRKNEAAVVLDDYDNFLLLANADRIPRPDKAVVKASRHIIAHESDVPILLSAIESRPDWLLTHNTQHFTEEVAQATCLRIATPIEFIRHMALAIQEYRRYQRFSDGFPCSSQYWDASTPASNTSARSWLTSTPIGAVG